jgi:hypothetical protein
MYFSYVLSIKFSFSNHPLFLNLLFKQILIHYYSLVFNIIHYYSLLFIIIHYYNNNESVEKKIEKKGTIEKRKFD